MKARSDNSFLEHSHSGLHRFEDTDLGAGSGAEDLSPIGTQVTVRAFSLSRHLSPEAQVRLPKRADVTSPDPRAGRESSQRGCSSGRYGQMREVLMRYKPKNVAALHIALAGLPDKMRVEVDPDIRMSAKTVAALRNVTAWSENFVIATPQERYPENAVRVSKRSLATRVSPKQ